ncbi:MFS transporter [Leptolyngbya sp. NIES-2104]|uniref:MFS transporter n=1 Tax=Leptolyngbya sp. NIES-2104 TaxID=1552121 RepID=UPI0006ECC144|nr:MFS transporter [Leptolyngbya sp. NIES-2104]GAP93860.1 AmpG permease [Leptolyngbya sp. NIES-2104]
MSREAAPISDDRTEAQISNLYAAWFFVPTLYFAAGLPYVLVNSASVILYKSLGIDNATLAFWTSILYFPWTIKLFWSPIVELYSTKRVWIVRAQLLMIACLSATAISLQLPQFFLLSWGCFAIAAFLSATQDTAIDGFYLLVLDPKAQAFYVGIRSTFYRIAMLFGSGLLVFVAGQLEFRIGARLAWTIVLALSALVFFILWIVHTFVLPEPETNSETQPALSTVYRSVIQSYFQQPKVGAVLAFILLYRLGEAMLVKLAAPFLLDAPEVGGLGLSTAQVGLAYGTLGSIALTLGGLLGGWLVSRYGVRLTLFPLAIALNLPHLFYVYLAYQSPSVQWIYLLVTIEQFGYGLGTAAYSFYLMMLATNLYKTSHFAISTSVMALGMMLPGLISGFIQQALGYRSFFWLVVGLSIVGMIPLLWIPIKDTEMVTDQK